MKLSLYECNDMPSILKYLTEADDDEQAAAELELADDSNITTDLDPSSNASVTAARNKLIDRIEKGRAAIHISDLFDKKLQTDSEFIERTLVPKSVSAMQERIMWAAWFLLNADKVDTSKLEFSSKDKRRQASSTAYLKDTDGVDPKRIESIAYTIGTLIEKFGANNNIIETLLNIAKIPSDGLKILSAVTPLFSQLLMSSSDLKEADFYANKPLSRKSTYTDAKSIDDLLYQIKAYILLKKPAAASKYDLKLLDSEWLKGEPINISETDRVKATDTFLNNYKPGSTKIKLDTFTVKNIFEDDNESNKFRSAADIQRLFDQAKQLSDYEVLEDTATPVKQDSEKNLDESDPVLNLIDALVKNDLIDEAKAEEIKNYGFDARNAFLDKFKNILTN